MTGKSNSIICPVRVILKGPEPIESRQYILIAVGETLCFYPRFDGLLVNLKNKSAFWYKNINTKIQTCHLDEPFEYEEAHRLL
jgi:hypothetical protein